MKTISETLTSVSAFYGTSQKVINPDEIKATGIVLIGLAHHQKSISDEEWLKLTGRMRNIALVNLGRALIETIDSFTERPKTTVRFKGGIQ
jgi:hypothetical protein